MRYFLIFILSTSLIAQSSAPTGLKHHKRIPWGPIIRSALLLTATAMDVQGQQQCLNRGAGQLSCVENNPLVSTNPHIVWPVEMTISSGAVIEDFDCWKKGRKFCWLGPVIGTGAHTAGALSGFTK